MFRVPSLFETKTDRWRTILLVVVLAAVVLTVGSVLVNRFPFLADPRELRAVLLGVGVLAPLAFVGVQIVQVLVAPVPGQALGFASGYLFGAFWGTVYSMVGIVIGTALAAGLARQFGRPYVERVVTADALTVFDDAMASHGLTVLFVVFLVPGLPDDALCFAAGLTDIPIRRIVAIAAVGRLPGFLLVNLAGSAAANDDPVLTAAFVAILLSASVLGYLYREQLMSLVSSRTPGR
ncbi:MULTISPECIES: TVP38/TMEM64 family protein [Haloferax]|uniref:TVP38/TMEM64 family protein n=1 Tax=Haloferax marinum TaxID=2666143 RepID=A0A6A8G6H3_9EURY|nr:MULTISPECIES: TVP38/TMEM64 family protein [Haloferax]KAB1196850.1 TVP38/TMEM64 family protein [Haloferax sp. CBA1150]MRW95863.1 TVP38/TMEM64 family protein [Haloferax marinum]